MFWSYIYQTFVYQPLFNLLIFLYNIIPGNDVGIAIIIVTIIIRLILAPLAFKSIHSQKAIQELQPKINEIKNKYKNDKEKLNKELLKFYQENKINPFSSCLPMLIQLPILFALYRVFIKGLNVDGMEEILYPFILKPDRLNLVFLGLVDLTQKSLILAVLAGVFQFIQSKLTLDKKKSKKMNVKDFSSIMSTQMVYFMPLITVFIAMTLPSALALYWIVTTLFAIGQQYIIMKKKPVFIMKKNHGKSK